MPGIPQRVMDIIGQLDSLSKVKPKNEEEAIGLQQARQQLMNEMKSASEGMGQMDPGALEGDGFTGRIDGQVIDAPWRGEYDMPGNFERRQKMANSLAEDAFLGAGLGSEYKFDPTQPMEGKIISSSPAMAANMPEFMNNKTAYFMGPPEPSKYGMPGDTRRMNRNTMMTEDDLKAMEMMMKLGSGGQRAVDRRFGDNEVYQYLKGQ